MLKALACLHLQLLVVGTWVWAPSGPVLANNVTSAAEAEEVEASRMCISLSRLRGGNKNGSVEFPNSKISRRIFARSVITRTYVLPST